MIDKFSTTTFLNNKIDTYMYVLYVSSNTHVIETVQPSLWKFKPLFLQYVTQLLVTVLSAITLFNKRDNDPHTATVHYHAISWPILAITIQTAPISFSTNNIRLGHNL
jgi:hypothetical protein